MVTIFLKKGFVKKNFNSFAVEVSKNKGYTYHMRVLGLDMGKKRIGVAVSDALGITAQPLTYIERRSLKKDMERIKELAHSYGVDTIVVGLPIRMDGSLGKEAIEIEEFARKLEETLSIRVVTWDERLSTSAVTRTLIEGDVRRKKRKTLVDKLSATYILQGYLDSQRQPHHVSET